MRSLIHAYTQDHGMIVVDQSEAHYSPNEMFFVDRADPDPEPFRIGGAKFWKDSACIWEKQLELYKNIQQMQKRDFPKLSEQAWVKEKKDRAEEDEEEEAKFRTNQEAFAPPEYRRALEEERKKELGKNHLTRAKERLASLWTFIPGTKY